MHNHPSSRAQPVKVTLVVPSNGRHGANRPEILERGTARRPITRRYRDQPRSFAAALAAFLNSRTLINDSGPVMSATER